MDTRKADRDLDSRKIDKDLDARKIDRDLDTRKIDRDLDVRKMDKELDARKIDRELDAKKIDRELDEKKLTKEEREKERDRAERKEDKERDYKKEKEEKERADEKEDKERDFKKEQEDKEREYKKEEDERAEARAAGDQHLYVGAVLGATRSATSNGTNSDSNISGTYGLAGGFKFSPSFGLGVLATRYGTTSSSTNLGLPIGSTSSTTLFLGQANFFIGGIHLGIEIGTAMNSWDGKISTITDGTSSNAMVYGPQVGIDFRLDKTLTLGGELHYLFSSAQNTSATLQGLAALKIWL